MWILGTPTAATAMADTSILATPTAAIIVAGMETLATPTAHMETIGMQGRPTTVMATLTVTVSTPGFLGIGGSMDVIMAVVTTGAIMSSRAGEKAAAVSGVIYPHIIVGEFHMNLRD